MTHHMHGMEETKITLPSDREIVIERVFDAPRDLVFRALLQPSLIPTWWGPRRYTTKVDEMDVRPGGQWRFIQWDSGCKEYAFNGKYREIVAPERVAYTFEFEGMPGHILLESVTLERLDGKTKVRITDSFDSVEDRDGMLKSGMEDGVKESQDRFAELLADLERILPC